MEKPLERPIVDFLRQLELEIKQKMGVVPEDVLVETRSQLIRDYASMRSTDADLSDDQVVERFRENVGEPATIAQHHEDQVIAASGGAQAERNGNAPNWRICCTDCGRSAPASKVGITRIAARSWHKYIGGWCQTCGRVRAMRLLRDLNRTNITDAIGRSMTGAELRSAWHKPKLVVAMIVAVVLASLVIVSMVVWQFLPK